MEAATVDAEAREHRVRRQRGDVAESAHTEAHEQARELLVVEGRHGPGREEFG